MTERIENIARDQLREVLPDAIRSAFASYRKFSFELSGSLPDKEFTLQHNACKAAIAHISSLIKLAVWADKDGDGEEREEIVMPGIDDEYKKYLEQHGDEADS